MARHLRGRVLASAHRDDLGHEHGAVGGEEGEHRWLARVAARRAVGAGQLARGGLRAARDEVHHQVGKVIARVDGAQRGVEFHAVDDLDLGLAHDVLGPQVAVAVAHQAALGTLAQQRAPARQPGPGERARGGDRIRVLGAHQRAERLDRARRARRQARHRVDARDCVRLGVEARQACPHLGDRERVPSLRERGEGLRLVEAAHLDEVVARAGIVGLAERERPVALDDGAHAQVDVAREPPVEGDLGLAHRPPALGGRVVQKWQADRFLELVRPLAGQEDPGDVRLAQLHGLGGAPEGRLAQRGDEVVGHGGSVKRAQRRCWRRSISRWMSDSLMGCRK